MVKIVKRKGKYEIFSKAKVAKGCMKAGASKKVATAVANAVSKMVVNGISTRWIGEVTIIELRVRDKKAAKNFANYFHKNWK